MAHSEARIYIIRSCNKIVAQELLLLASDAAQVVAAFPSTSLRSARDRHSLMPGDVLSKSGKLKYADAITCNELSRRINSYQY